MNSYQVGGAVRDHLLGLPVHDHDFVVVGATVADMLAQGYTQVGADFPVFLHPQTHDEYALARTERKSGVGYHGFLVGTENVTLEEDLARRDLTINAMALDAAGTLIDPYGGEADLHAKIFRHVSPAFAEDPVRVLRVLRFHARMGPHWRIAEETQALIASMIAAGELHHLTPERVWKEISRALREPHPDILVRGLVRWGLCRLPGFAAYQESPLAALETLSELPESTTLETRFCLAFSQGRSSPAFGAEIPRSVKLADQAHRIALTVAEQLCSTWSVQGTWDLLHVCGGLRNAEALRHANEALRLQGFGLANHLDAALAALARLDTKGITAALPPGPAVGRAIAAAQQGVLRTLSTSARDVD